MIRLLAALAALLFAAPLFADELRPGYLELTQRDAQHWRVVYKAPLVGGLATRTRPVFPPFCTIASGAVRLEGGSLVSLGELACSGPLAGATIKLDGIEAGFTDALVRIAPLGRPVQAERLSPARPQVAVAKPQEGGSVAATYFVLGIEHILTGYDHLLFVIALVLLLGRGWPVVKAATAFTAAHSLTLAGVTLGLFGLAQAPVEALIALSIVFLAVEIVKHAPGQPRLSQRVPWLVAFVFGLLHGFGFAGALREIGLPESEVPLALLTFNLGVEAGQLVIVAACLGAIALVRRLAEPALRPMTLTATYAIGITASYWFVERMIG
ncbi:MAG: HupE/UreJ family protein [Novosphingobium sp.]